MHFRRIGLPLLLVLAAACAPGTVVTVGVVVAVTPASALVQVGATQNFKATVFGTSDTAVAWSVQEATGGSVAADGTYTAPATAGTYHVVATSHADPTKSNAAAVSVSVPIVIALTPSTAALQAGASQKFQASVSGTTDKVVAWSVQEANGGSIAADGTYSAPTTSGTYHVTATSHADPGKSGSATVTVIGSVAPIVTITASPPSLTNQRGASFSFTSSTAGATFSCKLDSGAAAACTSPQSYSGLAAGNHTFAVTAKDAASNVSSPASSTWTIDLTAPVATITASPANPTSQTTASFSFSSSKAGSTFSCALDAGTAAACTSPKSYSGLATGSHAFMVTATDLAGNVSAPASFAWTITIAAGGLVISTPLTLDKTNVVAGDTLRGTVTYQNTSSSPISVQAVIIGGRPPGGTNGAGPYYDLTPTLAAQTVPPGATVTLAASRAFTAGDPTGSWYAFATYQDAGGAWHDGPSVNFTVAAPAGGLVISSPLTLDKLSALVGDTVSGTVTYTNTSASPIAIQQLAIVGVPPSPAAQLNFAPTQAATTLQPGATLTLTASRAFASADPTGFWQVKSSYQDAAGTWHDGPGLNLSVGPLAASSRLGANVMVVTDWDPTQLFADAMKQARHFGTVGTPSDEAAPVDANGWPTGDAAVIIIELNPGAWAAGTYALSFTGRATVAPSSARATGVTVSNVVYSGGVTTATVTVTSAFNGLWLQFTGTSGGVKNVSLMRPSKAGTPHPPGTLFTDRFRDRLKYFSTLRFMDYLSTNDNTQALWSDRRLPGYATQQSTRGSAYEYIVQLANQTGKDVWINVPHLALGSTYALGNTSYLTNLANLFKYGSDGVNPYTSPQASPIYPPLSPGLHVYVEFSNELWNGIFAQSGWLSAQSQAAINARDPDLCYDGTTNLWTVIPRLMAKAAMQVSDAFRAVYGDAGMMTTVRPVLAGQIANPGTFDGLSYLNARHLGSSHYLYAIAGAPYIDIADESAPLSVAQIFAEMTTYQASSLVGWITTLANTAKSYGVKLVSYEGGQTLYPSMGNATNKLAAQMDPRMKTQTTNLLHTWAVAGGDVFLYFNLSSGWDNSGYWGLAPEIGYDIDADPGYPTSELYPKWGAIKQIALGQ